MTARRQLGRVLASAGFSKNMRLSQFLRFVVERHLEGRERELKESVIGVEVFGRKPGFDPKVDGIVRTEAIRLRARLDKYYAAEGSTDPLVIELPKGGYRPIIRERRTRGEAWIKSAWRWRFAKAVAGVLVAALGASVWWSAGPAAVAVAVLPFENLSRDTARDYVSDGLTDQLISSLAVIEGLTVPSRTSSFALRGRIVSAVEAGSELGADYLVEGSVVQTNDRVRVNAALIRVRDDHRVWSGRFDRELTDVFRVQEEISQGIVDTLRLRLGPRRRRYEEHIEPYTLYLRARQMMASFPSQGRPIVDSALDYYEQALAKDASFALAYAGIADLYLAVERNVGVAPKFGPDLLAQAKTSAKRALDLDPLLSEAHSSMGSIGAREYAWKDAEHHFRRAIELNHNNVLAHLELGFPVLLMQGRVDEGLDEVRRAVRLDPLSPYVNTESGRALFWARRYDAAIDQLRIAIALEPSRARPYGVLARALSAQGKTGEPLAVFEDAVRRGALLAPLANGDLACVVTRAGRPDAVAAMLRRQQSSLVANTVAKLYTCLRDAPRALSYLEQAFEANEPNLAEIIEAPDSDWLRADPRLVTLRQKLNLP
jgi:adenylate cyclase